jgi:hypothetical protein
LSSGSEIVDPREKVMVRVALPPLLLGLEVVFADNNV